MNSANQQWLRPLEPFASDLGEPYFTPVTLAPPEPSHLVAWNTHLARAMGFPVEHATAVSNPGLMAILSGRQPWPGYQPVAHRYAGHQFGVWVPQLGDGRAALIAEIRAANGEHRELQLKGGGLTPYSRMGDGRAVLRSTIREYLCSEAMHGLGIPTTRALALFESKEPVQREQIETAATLIRVAPSHLRFGSFEYYYHRGEHEALKRLIDFALEHWFPEAAASEEPLVNMLHEVVRRTAELMADWQAVGFCHGVMNTDNMSLLGLTIDYGPYGFLDAYDPHHICNHSDHAGRYAYSQQPAVGHWNLVAFISCFLPQLGEERARAILDHYPDEFERAYGDRLRAKFGLLEGREGDDRLYTACFKLLQNQATDYTRFFRALCDFDEERPVAEQTVLDEITDRKAAIEWLDGYRSRLLAEHSDGERRRAAMRQTNPRYVLRNHLAEMAIQRARDEGDFSEVERLCEVLSRPFDEQPEHARYADLPPDWAAGLSVSCSS